jgi:hypothetical protein
MPLNKRVTTVTVSNNQPQRGMMSRAWRSNDRKDGNEPGSFGCCLHESLACNPEFDPFEGEWLKKADAAQRKI